MITPISGTMTKEEYELAAANFIGDVEGNIPFIYKDTAGLPTIGIGHLLEFAGKTKIEFEDELALELGRTVTLTTVGWNNLITGNFYPANNNNDTVGLTITAEESVNLFKSDYTTKENLISNTYSLSDLPYSKERIVLLFLAYNGLPPSKTPTTKSMILSNDPARRIKIWYELRYNSNSATQTSQTQKGITTRRIKESNYFGMTQETQPSVNENKQIIRFLESKRDDINSYITRVRGVGASISTNDLDNNMSSIKNSLISSFAQGVTINGEIIIGTGIGNIPE